MDTAQLDAALSSAVADGSLAGVVAAAWSERGLSYTGAFGELVGGQPARPDTMLWIASMTKALTAAAAMQLVERGVLELDRPAGDLVDYLRDVQVLDGIDEQGAARLRPPSNPVTMRHLLTHTSGFGYDWADASLARHVPTLPTPEPGSQASYEHPLTFDPGTGWSYGIGIDWAGRVVEAASGQRLDAYLRDHLLGPLGMDDTTFAPSPAQRDRMAEIRLRSPDGLHPMPFALPEDPEMLMGGGGMYSTVTDYLRFTRMILGLGALDDVRVLQPETVELMAADHIAGITAPGWTTCRPILSNDVELFPGERVGWGLSFMINTRRTAQGRSPGSLAWAGLANTYYWIDRTAGVTGVFATQVLPFWDGPSRAAFASFEEAVYATIEDRVVR